MLDKAEKNSTIKQLLMLKKSRTVSPEGKLFSESESALAIPVVVSPDFSLPMAELNNGRKDSTLF